MKAIESGKERDLAVEILGHAESSSAPHMKKNVFTAFVSKWRSTLRKAISYGV